MASLQKTTIGRTTYVRDPEGTWRYADDLLPVPGARDGSLTETYEPRFVSASSGTVEEVMLDLTVVQGNPELEWCLSEGHVMGDPSDPAASHVIVPYSSWLEHERTGALSAPELSDDPDERRVAEAERDYRRANRRLARAARARREALARASQDGMTRRRAAEIAGLTPGRIQQLIGEQERLSETARQIVHALGEAKREKRSPPRLAQHIDVPADAIRAGIDELLERDFLDVDVEAGEWRLTLTGQTFFIVSETVAEVLREAPHRIGRGPGSDG
jgi:hypothetical protein